MSLLVYKTEIVKKKLTTPTFGLQLLNDILCIKKYRQTLYVIMHGLLKGIRDCTCNRNIIVISF